MIKSEIFYEEVETNNDFAKMLQLELIKKDNEIEQLKIENEKLKRQINDIKRLDRMRFNMLISHYGILEENK